MYIQELRLRNFKTYKTARIYLSKGLTVITGPNGSGKSNIVEAILFGLREFRPRALRASTFSELIRREPGGASNSEGSVTLYFSDESGENTIRFKRKITNSGKIGYYVNGRSVRRRDYVGSMLTRPNEPINYRYLAQGTIIKTAEMTPSERRKLLEDIVGLSVYDEKRNSALKTLEEADLKLSIAVAKIDEIRGNLISLFREATLASRKTETDLQLRKLTAATRTLEVDLLLDETEALDEELDEKTTAMEKRRGQKTHTTRTLGALRKDVQELNRFLQERGGRELLEFEKLRTELKSRLGRTRWLVTREKEKIESLLNDESRLQRAADDDRRSLHLSHEEISGMNKEIDANEKLVARLTQKKEDSEAQLASTKQEKEAMISLAERKASIKDDLFSRGIQREAERRVSALRREIAELELAGARNRLEILRGSEASIRSILEKMRERRAEEAQRVSDIRKRILSLERRKKRIDKEIVGADKVLKKAMDIEQRIRVKKKFREKVGRRVRDVKKVADVARRGLIPSVLGTVEDLVEVSAENKRLCSIVCGDRWHSLVVEDWEGAKKAYELAGKLKREISVLVLYDYAGKDSETPDENQLLSRLKMSDRIRPMMKELLGDTVVVKDLQEGMNIATSGIPAIDQQGRFHIRRGMLSTGIGALAIPLRRGGAMNLKDIRMALANFSEMIEIRNKDARDLENETKKVGQELVSRIRALENTRGTIRAFRSNLRTLERISKTVEKRIRALAASLSEILESEEKLDSEMEELLGQVSEIDGRSRAETLVEMDNTIDQLERLRVEIEHEISVLGISNESVRQRMTQLQDSIRRAYHGNLQLKLEKIREIRRDITRTRRRLASRKSQEREISENIMGLGKRIAGLEKRVSRIRKEISEKEEEILALQAELSRSEKELEPLWGRIARIRERKASLKERVDRLVDEIEALGFGYPLPIEHPEYAQKLTDMLELETQRIGSVNPLARRSYTKKIRVYKRFSVRRNELERERNSILLFIQTIDNEKERLFLETFHAVNERFSEVFQQMHPEGQAWLEIEDVDNILNSGIAVMVQFPSKPMVEMTSLSGGEKSIVVVAFLLALQKVEQGAIYLFDEIDAHLDPNNVERFVKVLKHSSRHSQTIVVTLKPSVAEAADNLIGVTMRDQKSRVVPVPRKMLVRSK